MAGQARKSKQSQGASWPLGGLGPIAGPPKKSHPRRRMLETIRAGPTERYGLSIRWIRPAIEYTDAPPLLKFLPTRGTARTKACFSFQDDDEQWPLARLRSHCTRLARPTLRRISTRCPKPYRHRRGWLLIPRNEEAGPGRPFPPVHGSFYPTPVALRLPAGRRPRSA